MSEQTEKLEAIFHAASELTASEERESYLNKACLEDEDLRKRVDALLKAVLTGEELFGNYKQIGGSSGSIEMQPLAEQSGAVIGRYKLLEKIGEGGMGVVYMAEQEQPVRRKVALKIIKLGMDTRQVVTRFEAERQALAMMEHPNIAQVLDAGATKTGRPFFVMELVHGVPLTEFCKANQLSIDDRIKLFIPVCQAIQSAHQKGIIHRDIKPSNVLVTMHNGAPYPMVIDFGVAKAIDQKLTEQTLFTHFTTMIGTPAFMSPEQAQMSKLDVDTRSDIYSLGVLLYELLTGTTPFPEERLRSVAYGEMQRIILEEEPERPSTRLRKKPIGRAPIGNIGSPPSIIDSDLDWIVMKCLEKDRNRRYETANALASDLQAHSNNEPVLARPASAAYRFQKFVRRNKLEFAAATFALVVLSVAVVVSGSQAFRAKRAEETSRERAKDAEAIKDFLVRQVLAVNPYIEPKPDPGRRAMVDRVALSVQTEFADRPKIEGELCFALGIAYVGLGDSPEAVKQFEKSHAIRRKILGPQDSDTLWALATTAALYPSIGRSQEGKDLITKALEVVRSSPHPLSSGEAEVLWVYGWLLSKERRPAEALPYLRESMVVAKQTLDPKDFRIRNKMWELAHAATQAKQWAEAERLWAEGVRQCEQEFDEMEHPITAAFLKGQAHLFLQLDRAEDAQRILERALPIYHRTLPTNHHNVLDAEGLLAEAYEKVGRLEDSAKLYASLSSRWEKHLPSATALDKYDDIVSFFIRQRRYDDAKAVFQLLNDFSQTNPPVSSEHLEMMIAGTAAIKGWCAAVEVFRKYGDHFPSDPTKWRSRSSVALYCGDEDACSKVTAQALALVPATTNWQDQLAILHIAARGPLRFSPEQARQCEALVQSVERALPGVSPQEQTRAHRAIGALQLRLSDLTNSLAHLEHAVQTAKEPAARARTLLIKALCLHRLGRTEAARADLAEAEAVLKPLLFDRLTESEGFLSDADRYDILLHREAQALLGLK